MTEKRCGKVAIVGRPNVGKSTLLNKILGEKVSITAPKPQTTRHRILGVKTDGPLQVVYVDTPGIHRGAKRVLNRRMNRVAIGALHDVDVVVFMVEGLFWKRADQQVLQSVKKFEKPTILVINQIDKVKQKEKLFAHIEMLTKEHPFCEIIPLSAKTGKQVKGFEKTLSHYLPKGEHLYAPDHLTDRTEMFAAAELVREQLTRQLHQEVPYSLAVEIEKFEHEEKLLRIGALIFVETPGQKAIVIGEKGSRLREVGRLAREAMERMFDKKVFLELWVKVKPGWPDDEGALDKMRLE